MDLQVLFNLADPRIRKIWNEKSTQLSQRLEYQNLGYKDSDAEIRDPQFDNFTGLGLATLTGEKQPYSSEEKDQTSTVTISPQKWTNSIDISEEQLRFKLWPQINEGTGAIANSLYGRIDTEAAKLFYLGFGTTFQSGPDSLSLFNAAHTRVSTSGTQSNTTTNTLSYENLKTAAQAIDRFEDDKGIQLMPCRNLCLIVAREKKERAIEVLRSIGNPDNAQRVSNVFNTGESTIQLVTANWIPRTTYNNYWFLVDKERASMMLHMVWGWRPRFDSDNAIKNGTKIYTGSAMFKPGFQAWQFGYGSSSAS